MSANDFLDVPPRFKLVVPITIEDRVNGICWDQHHCTIANAIVRLGHRLGITALGHRGVSRTMVDFYLDPQKFKWAKSGQKYRGRLTANSAVLAAELDDYLNKPLEHRRLKARLQVIAATAPDGLDTVWNSITIVAPKPSQAKGYRSGSSGHSGPRSPVGGAPNRRYNGFPLPVAQPPARRRKVKVTP